MAYAYVELANKDKANEKQYQRAYLGLSWTSLFFAFYPSIYRTHLKTILKIITLYFIPILVINGLFLFDYMYSLEQLPDLYGWIILLGLLISVLFLMSVHIGMFFFFNKYHLKKLLKDGYEVYNAQYISKCMNKKYELTFKQKKSKVKFKRVKKEISHA